MFTRDELLENISTQMPILQDYKGINNEKLAKLVGITPAAISQFKNKKRLMRLPVLCKICFVLGSSLESMVGYSQKDAHELTIIDSKIDRLKEERKKILMPLKD
jgi:DNA-binding Xre family transcriptional regulator